MSVEPESLAPVVAPSPDVPTEPPATVAGPVAPDLPRSSWQVTGIRKDAWAEAHRIPVEEEKTGQARGTYLHPREHGKPASKGIEAARLARIATGRAAQGHGPALDAGTSG